MRIFRGTRHLNSKGWIATGSWIGIVVLLWVIAWIIAESIPVFNDLLSLISALFASCEFIKQQERTRRVTNIEIGFTYGLGGVFWLFMNKGQYFSTPTKGFLTILNIWLFIMGLSICGIGLYASGEAIHDDASSSSGSWTCAYTGQ